MPIELSALRAAGTLRKSVAVRSLHEARVLGARTAFLCHSHHDSDLAAGLVSLLADAGWRVYVDWEDTVMPEIPNRETAKRIQQKIVELDYFLFLATPRSTASRWCPWEIGFADGKKHIDQILIVPTTDGSQTHGNEYLQLYRRVDLSDQEQIGVWNPHRSEGVLIKDL
jgi:hypothetical protein